MVPRLTRPSIEGLYDYSYRINVPRTSAAKADSRPSSSLPEQHKQAAQTFQQEAETLRAQGSATALREAALKYEESLRSWRAAGRFSEPAEMAGSL
ncbi:MAG TPA: hypothetical protein PKC13_28015, partial [Blastocatellia bacterium]|nr:hypothetical protein [Blastocatellia bacterium]